MKRYSFTASLHRVMATIGAVLRIVLRVILTKVDWRGIARVFEL